MAPGRRALDDEIRGHIAISIQERIERGEDPEAARLAAMKEFGNLLLTRESIESVWRPHARTVVVDETAGTHATMLSTLHAETTAACVSRHLSRDI